MWENQKAWWSTRVQWEQFKGIETLQGNYIIYLYVSATSHFEETQG